MLLPILYFPFFHLNNLKSCNYDTVITIHSINANKNDKNKRKVCYRQFLFTHRNIIDVSTAVFHQEHNLKLWLVQNPVTQNFTSSDTCTWSILNCRWKISKNILTRLSGDQSKGKKSISGSSCYFDALVFTDLLLTKGDVTFFRTEKIVANFLHLIVLSRKVSIKHCPTIFFFLDPTFIMED